MTDGIACVGVLHRSNQTETVRAETPSGQGHHQSKDITRSHAASVLIIAADGASPESQWPTVDCLLRTKRSLLSPRFVVATLLSYNAGGSERIFLMLIWVLSRPRRVRHLNSAVRVFLKESPKLVLNTTRQSITS